MRSARSLVEEAKAFQPDLVLILKGESLRASTLEQLKAKTRATLAVWWVDHPFMNVETRPLVGDAGLRAALRPLLHLRRVL